MTVVEGHGFILLSRKVFSEHSPYWCERREFSKFEAWLDLIQSAAYSDHQRVIRGRKVTIHRGSLVASERFLLRRWGWKSVGKVRRFLDALVSDGRLERDAKTEQLTVTNYVAYQGERSGDGAVAEQSRSSDGAATEQREVREKKGKKGEENGSCSEPGKPASEPASDDPLFMEFPVVANEGRPWLLRVSKVEEYRNTFPDLPVELELRAARQWCIDNVARRKTPDGMARFLTGWLKKAQNDGRGGGRASARRPPPGAFGADDQRRQQAADLDRELGLR